LIYGACMVYRLLLPPGPAIIYAKTKGLQFSLSYIFARATIAEICARTPYAHDDLSLRTKCAFVLIQIVAMARHGSEADSTKNKVPYTFKCIVGYEFSMPK